MPQNEQSHVKPVCGARTRSGKPCQQTIVADNGRCKKHGAKAGAPEGNQNAVGHGPPPGNQNAKTHGLFSKALGDVGREVYEAAKQMPAEELARDAAEFAVAKIAEAFTPDGEPVGIVRLIAEFLSQLVDQEEISAMAADRIIRRLQEPDIATMAKAMAPLKGLLGIKDGPAVDVKIESGPLTPDQVRRMAHEVVARDES